jgi:protein TonB
MTAQGMDYRDRLRAGIPVLIIHAALAFALIYSFVLDLVPRPPEELQLIDVPRSLPPPPPRIRPEHERSRRREGAASPPNLEARPTEVVAPPPVIPQPPPLPAAPIAGPGDKPTAGAAPIPGPGTGAGGQGNGTGSGGSGNGPGGGGGEGGETPPRHIRGTIRDGDYPRGAATAGIGGTVSVIYAVETDGRATHCAITRSSGNAELDETTCRLIEERFRFEPSRDRNGRPIRSRIVQDHEWDVQNLPSRPDDEDEPQPRPRRRFGF